MTCYQVMEAFNYTLIQMPYMSKSSQLSRMLYYAPNKSVSQITLSMERKADVSTFSVNS